MLVALVASCLLACSPGSFPIFTRGEFIANAAARGAVGVDGAQRPTPLPRFSWDTVPAFFHSSYTQQLTFPASALELIGKFPIVTVAKFQGCHAPGYECEDEALIAAGRQIKTLSSNISVIAWYDSFRIYSNNSVNPSAIDHSDQFCISSRHSAFLEAHTDYLLKNSTGQLAIESYCHLHVYDYVKPYVQQYWTEMCLNITRTGFFDGCGCDGSMSRASPGDSGQIPHIAADYAAKWNVGKVTMMNTTRLALNGGLLLGKEPWELGTYVDAILHEHCDANNKTILMLRNVTSRSRTLGVPLILQCHFHAVTEDRVAAFLVGAGPYQYFGAGSFHHHDDDFSSHWDDKLLGSPLGEPQGDGIYDDGSAVWSRKFSTGTAVTFNAKANKGSIDWGQ